MNFELRITESARLDISDSILYYSEISNSLLLDYTIQLNELLLKIQSNPEIYQKKYKEIRIAFFRKFPFGVHFLLEGNCINVFRVLHVKRLYS